MAGSALLRGLAALIIPVAPIAALDTPAPSISTGDAIAAGPEAVENTGGNVEVGKGETHSKVVVGDPAAAPALPGAKALVAPVVPKNPGADAVARARALVDAAKARAQAQIDAARAQAAAAVEQAHQTAEDAHARSSQQSAEAKARAEAASR